MNLFLKPKEAAPVLGVNAHTVRNWINRGVITHVITNGVEGKGGQYWIDMTRQYGITKEDYEERLFLPAKDVAELLGVHEATVRKWIGRGAIEHVLTNGVEGYGSHHLVDVTRQYGITRADYAAWRESRLAAVG